MYIYMYTSCSVTDNQFVNNSDHNITNSNKRLVILYVKFNLQTEKSALVSLFKYNRPSLLQMWLVAHKMSEELSCLKL